jgi:hypothetical protein
MMLTDAAERVLMKFGRPLHSKEIVEYAVKQGWIIPTGKTPDHSLQAALWTDIKRKGSRSRFRMVGNGRVDRKYWLRQPK